MVALADPAAPAVEAQVNSRVIVAVVAGDKATRRATPVVAPVKIAATHAVGEGHLHARPAVARVAPDKLQAHSR